MFDRPTLILNVEGGVVQDMAANVPGLQVFVVDFDTEGADTDRLTKFEEGEAVVGCHEPDDLETWRDSFCWQAVQTYLSGSEPDN